LPPDLEEHKSCTEDGSVERNPAWGGRCCLGVGEHRSEETIQVDIWWYHFTVLQDAWLSLGHKEKTGIAVFTEQIPPLLSSVISCARPRNVKMKMTWFLFQRGMEA
jgi:hypothetical protein